MICSAISINFCCCCKFCTYIWMIQNHNPPIINVITHYKLFQWGKLIMILYRTTLNFYSRPRSWHEPWNLYHMDSCQKRGQRRPWWRRQWRTMHDCTVRLAITTMSQKWLIWKNVYLMFLFFSPLLKTTKNSIVALNDNMFFNVIFLYLGCSNSHSKSYFKNTASYKVCIPIKNHDGSTVYIQWFFY